MMGAPLPHVDLLKALRSDVNKLLTRHQSISPIEVAALLRDVLDALISDCESSAATQEPKT